MYSLNSAFRYNNKEIIIFIIFLKGCFDWFLSIIDFFNNCNLEISGVAVGNGITIGEIKDYEKSISGNHKILKIEK